MKLLLSSNSTLAGEPYLQFCKDKINSFLAKNEAVKVIFVPYAAVTFSYDDYLNHVKEGLSNKHIELTGIHQWEDKRQAIRQADAIMVGGGNTFHLAHEIYRNDLMETLKSEVASGKSYIGWSAGSNLACPSIKTTNDMPILLPPSFDAMRLIPFQINPHYTHGNPPGHNGETREDRIKEFLQLNQQSTVVGLREGTMLEVDDDDIHLIGDKQIRIFRHGTTCFELGSKDDLRFLLKEAAEGQ